MTIYITKKEFQELFKKNIKSCKKMTLKQMIKKYVDDHDKHFGFYPYEIEIDGQVYSYGGYWEILNDERFD